MKIEKLDSLSVGCMPLGKVPAIRRTIHPFAASSTAVTKFSVATTRSWKDDNGEWKAKTQWHNVLAFGQGFAQIAPRLLKGTHVFVQGELSTREYDRTITIPNGKKSIEHVIQQLAVELKTDTIRILDRTASSGAGEAIQPAADEDVPL